ncbi:MAG: ABC transporter permease [Acidimicrobiales bacterium]
MSATADRPAWPERPERPAWPERRDTRSVSPRRLLLRRFRRSRSGMVGLAIIVLLVLVATFAGVVAPGNPLALDAPGLQEPSWTYPFGTDNLGRDLYVAVVHGARTTLSVVFWTLLISTAIGLPLGIYLGFKRNVASATLYRFTELVQVFPRFYLALLVVGLYGSSQRNLILVLAFTSWTNLARVVRAETLALKEREFVSAARSYGAPDRRILRRHLFPHVLPASVVMISLTASRVTLIEASLSFLGLGDPNKISWGFLASNATRYLHSAWWMLVFPGAAIAIAVIGFNLFGDGLADILRPSTVPGTTGGRRWRRRTPKPPDEPPPTTAVTLEDVPPEDDLVGVPTPAIRDPIVTS